MARIRQPVLKPKSENMSIVSLSQMKAGEKGEVKELIGKGDICHRLLEMGITRGTQIEVIRFAPMGDPIDIMIRGYHLSLRRQEAEAIQVTLSDLRKKAG